MKHWMKIVLGVVVAVVIIVVALPFLVNANTFRPMLEVRLTTALGRQVKLGDLSLSVLSGSLVANNLSIADDTKFSTTPFLKATQLRIGVEMKPLIFSRQLKVRSFEAESPEIHLVRAADGTWNFSTLGRGRPRSMEVGQHPESLPELTVGVIAIKDGRATVESLPAHGQPLVCEHLNFSVHQFSFVRSFPFTLAASLPGDGTVAVAGTAGPINQQDVAMTGMQAQLTVKHLDPVVAGLVDAAVGVSMLADVDAHAVSNGVTVTSSGTVHAQRLQIMKGGSPAPQPVELTYNLAHTLKDNSGQILDLAVKTGNVAAHVSGSYQLAASDPVVNLKLTGDSLPIDSLQALLPAAGVKLPSGSALKGGTLTTALAITGPAKDTTIAGPVELNNTRLVGFNLGSKLAGIAALGGVKMGDTTSIQTLRMNVQVTNAGVRTDNVYALLPALGEVNGAGTMSAGGALAYRLVVKLSTSSGIGQAGVGLLSALNQMAGGAASAAAKNGVPVVITGTMSNPVVTADVKGLLQRNASSFLGQSKGQPSAIDALTSIFGKK